MKASETMLLSELRDEIDRLIKEHGDDDVFYEHNGKISRYPSIQFTKSHQVDTWPYIDEDGLQKDENGLFVSGFIMEWD